MSQSCHGPIRKYKRVLSPNIKGCSVLLKRAAREKIDFLENAKTKLEYKI